VDLVVFGHLFWYRFITYSQSLFPEGECSFQNLLEFMKTSFGNRTAICSGVHTWSCQSWMEGKYLVKFLQRRWGKVGS